MDNSFIESGLDQLIDIKTETSDDPINLETAVKNEKIKYLLIFLSIVMLGGILCWSFFFNINNGPKMTLFIFDEYYYCNNGTVISNKDYKPLANIISVCRQTSYTKVYMILHIIGWILTFFHIIASIIIIKKMKIKKITKDIIIKTILIFECWHIIVNILSQGLGITVVGVLDDVSVGLSYYTYSIGMCICGSIVFVIAICVTIYIILLSYLSMDN
jgi:hypothetical protein